MECVKTKIIFIVSNLIFNQKVTNGTIIQIQKIIEYCPELKEEDIRIILQCFIKEGMIVEQKQYQCKENHTFTPSKDNYEFGYDCLECAALDIDEEERFIEPENLEDYFLFSTYKINKLNQDVWNARSYALSGDYKSAAESVHKVLLEENKDFDKLEKKDKIEKISQIFSITSDSSSLLTNVPKIYDEIMKYFS